MNITNKIPGFDILFMRLNSEVHNTYITGTNNLLQKNLNAIMADNPNLRSTFSYTNESEAKQSFIAISNTINDNFNKWLDNGGVAEDSRNILRGSIEYVILYSLA